VLNGIAFALKHGMAQSQALGARSAQPWRVQVMSPCAT
jgi:hypothetical protein